MRPPLTDRGDSILIRPARPGEERRLAHLMITAIHWGEFQHLGSYFNTLVHRHFISSPQARCYVAEQRGSIAGYAAWALDTAAFHRQFVRRYGLQAVLGIAPRLVLPGTWRPLLRGLSYGPSGHPDDPPAEILSFAIQAELRGAGVGRRLFDALLAEFRRLGVRRLKVGTVAEENVAVNRWYRSLGFDLVRTDQFYSDTRTNVYVLTLT